MMIKDANDLEFKKKKKKVSNFGLWFCKRGKKNTKIGDFGEATHLYLCLRFIYMLCLKIFIKKQIK